MSSAIVDRFNRILWHDSKLLGLSFFRSDGDERVKVSLQLVSEGGVLTPSELVFEGSTYIQLSIDLTGKRLCADDIAGAMCYGPRWTERLSLEHPHDNFEGYLHFRIGLIAPGGTVDVLAKGFALTSVKC
jgi:hypothetical protein